MKPIIRKPPTFCRDCNANTIDIFNQYDSPIGYFNIIRSNGNKSAVMAELNTKKHLVYMKCTRCGKTYRIDWENEMPRPLYDERTEYQIKSGTIFQK